MNSRVSNRPHTTKRNYSFKLIMRDTVGRIHVSPEHSAHLQLFPKNIRRVRRFHRVIYCRCACTSVRFRSRRSERDGPARHPLAGRKGQSLIRHAPFAMYGTHTSVRRRNIIIIIIIVLETTPPHQDGLDLAGALTPRNRHRCLDLSG